MTSTSSTRRCAPARRSPSSTVTPTRSPLNCQGTLPLSRRLSPPAEQVFRDGDVARIGHLQVSFVAGKGADLFVGVLLHARRRVGALESVGPGSPVCEQQRA